MLPQKNYKIQGFAGAFWSGFGSYELRVQLTSAHTRALRNCECESYSLAEHGDGAKKEHAPLLEPCLSAPKGVGASDTCRGAFSRH